MLVLAHVIVSDRLKSFLLNHIRKRRPHNANAHDSCILRPLALMSQMRNQASKIAILIEPRLGTNSFTLSNDEQKVDVTRFSDLMPLIECL